MADISSLYPAPPSFNNQNALTQNPLQTAGALLQLQQGQLGLQKMRAEQAAGAAFQSAINPDGTFNPNAALAGIRNNPDAAFAAPGAISTGLAQQGNILDNRNREISIATNKLNLGVANNDAFAKIAAPYALQPKMSDEDVLNLKVKAAAAGVNPTTIAAADVRTPVKAMRAANLAAKQTMGPATAAQPTRGAPSATANWMTRPPTMPKTAPA